MWDLFQHPTLVVAMDMVCSSWMSPAMPPADPSKLRFPRSLPTISLWQLFVWGQIQADFVEQAHEPKCVSILPLVADQRAVLLGPASSCRESWKTLKLRK